MGLKQFLTGNKIYFEVFSYFIVGGATLVIAFNANELANNQNLLLEYQNRPQFDIQFTEGYERTDDGVENYREKLSVLSVGGIAYNFELEPFYFIKIYECNNNTDENYIEDYNPKYNEKALFSIPVLNCFNQWPSQVQVLNRSYDLVWLGNPAKSLDCVRSKLLYEYGQKGYYVELERNVHVCYKTFSGKFEDRYFNIDHGIVEMDQNDAEKIISDFENKAKRGEAINMFSENSDVVDKAIEVVSKVVTNKIQ